MKIVDYTQYKEKQQSPNWFLTFFTGIILGGFVVWWNKDKFLQDSYFLGEEVFKRFGYTSIYKEGFFYYILKNRMEQFSLLVLASFTCLIKPVFLFFVLWFGMSGGVIGITLLLKFGIRGVWLFIGLFFPHILIYIPCFLGLMKKMYQFRKKQSTLSASLFVILPFLLFLLAGILVESYVNPFFLKKIIYFFW